MKKLSQFNTSGVWHHSYCIIHLVSVPILIVLHNWCLTTFLLYYASGVWHILIVLYIWCLTPFLLCVLSGVWPHYYWLYYISGVWPKSYCIYLYICLTLIFTLYDSSSGVWPHSYCLYYTSGVWPLSPICICLGQFLSFISHTSGYLSSFMGRHWQTLAHNNGEGGAGQIGNMHQWLGQPAFKT